MPNTPLRYRPGAIATPLGWAHEKTGEQIVSARNLDPDTGTASYKPNSRNWMADYQASGDSPTPNAFDAFGAEAAGLDVTVTGKIKYARPGDDVVINWGDASAVSTVTPAIDGAFTANHTYVAGTFTINAEVGAYTPAVVEELEITVTA